MIPTILIYLNVMIGLSLTIYIFLHLIFNDTITYKRRLSLIFPAFSMTCYTIAGFEWAYHVYYGTNFDNQIVLWFVVSWLVVLSIGVIAHCNWSPDNAEGH